MASNPKTTGRNVARKGGAGATSEQGADAADKNAAKTAGAVRRRAAAKLADATEKPAAKTKPDAGQTAGAVVKAEGEAKTASAAKAGARPAAKAKAATAAKKPAAKSKAAIKPAARAKAAAKPAARKPRAGGAKAPVAAAPRSAPRPTAPTSAAKAAPKAADRAPQNPAEAGFETIFATPVALPHKLTENAERIEALSHRLISALAQRATPNPAIEGPGQELFASAAQGFLKTMTEHPMRMIEWQAGFWAETLTQYARAQQEFLKGSFLAPEDDGPKDRRFKNPLWSTHPFFNYVKRQYQINAQAMRDAMQDLDLPDPVARKRIDWMTSQLIDMLAPTNFLATNPDALERAIETEGESLVRGLENLVADVEANGGEFLVSLADRDAFTVGENVGTAEGRVVHRTPLFELIQYSPTTDQVRELPIVLFPPWINKFYILDLTPQNSLIRWVVDQGYTLFVISWKNPDGSYADTGMDDYVSAYLEATDKAREICGTDQVNAVGYCIAGTTLSATLGLLEKRGDERVNSATFFTTLTDFSDLGEFVPFLQDDFIGGIEEEVARKGVFGAQYMSRTMSFLRANDLVWGPAIRNYMMGDKPPAFDLLFWNGDSTNLPGRMALEYLEGLCRENRLVNEGFPVLGETVTLADVKVPLCSVACHTDHIAPWKDCWRGVARMGSKDKHFILSESGHIAGIVNPPSKKKYGHYLGPKDFSGSHTDWQGKADYHEGSWWPVWGEWLAERSGKMVPARQPAQGLGPAPGEYVHERAIR